MSEQDRIAEVWTDAVGQHIAGLTDSEYAEMLSRFRPQAAATPGVDESKLPVTRRSAFTAKCDKLADLSATCGPNGYQGIADAASARAPQAPQPEQPPAPQGYAVNRAQGSQSGAGTPPPPTTTIRLH